MTISIEELQRRLREAGLKATPQRLAILRIITESDEHPSAEMIFAQLEKTHPGISLGTVYKALDSFLEKGLARRISTEGEVMRYDGKAHKHHHLRCTATGRILDYEDEELDALLSDYFRKKGFQTSAELDIQLNITGNFASKTTTLNF